ncbi:uncharacterized mitochondrial protein AtMg00860-like [Cryptomeria japonica]|uniref:uncharacterized mitochondrial protein AtMg00860-like n=1 Tax=Cryptomeria japonica TaxID=3369 RepID=UPI0027DA7C1A|nr:uncharacterized mitochondrial protein AtMg00860-like [Cryptomeria japonica]
MGLFEWLVMPFGLANAPATFMRLMHEHNNLYANFSKCSFGETSISYLGYIIDAHGVQVDPVKVEVLFKWPTPSNITELRSFLGLANFYHKFILHYSNIATPLHQLAKASVAFKWTKIHSRAFNTLKEKLCSTHVLVQLDLSQPFEIETYASQYALGAVLKQNGHPVAYHLEKISSAKRNYSTYDKELYALVKAIKYWRHYLLGKETVVHTDHLPLQFLQS